MTFDAIIFDLDGTLVDSERLSQQAGIAAMAQQGVTTDMDFMAQLTGKDEAACAIIVRETYGAVDFVQLDRDWTAGMKATFDQIGRMPGALEALQELQDAGFKIAVATSSRRANAQTKLDQTELAPFVQVLVSRDDVERPKPNPEPFLTAAAQLDADPRRCLAVEDTPTGVAAALAAGMTVLHIPDMVQVATSDAQILAKTLLDGLHQAGALTLQTP